VSELEGGGDVAGGCLLVDRRIAQDLRSFNKKQHKIQKQKGKDRKEIRKTATSAKDKETTPVAEVSITLVARNSDCSEEIDCGVEDIRDDELP